MTDPPGPPGDDIQRPLDESRPGATPGESEPAPELPTGPAAELSTGPDTGPAALRPAAPATPAEMSPEPEPGGRTGSVPALLRPARAVWGFRRRSGRAVRAFARWTSRPAGRFTLPGLLIAALLGVALSTGAFLVPTTGPGPAGAPGQAGSPPSGFPDPTAAPTVPPPLNTPGSVPTGQGDPHAALADWAAQTQARTDIPVVALQAYGYAELAARSTTPGCQLTWTTLAAIGRVESNHGSSSGARLLPDGRALPQIIGLPLDGEGDRAEITDTDSGALDGDLTYDRAVGPMQFIPSTWRLEAVDATGDGIADVHNIHDAALASANYLCRNGRDLTTAAGWWGAVLSYNNLQSYAEAVFAAANDYGQASRAGAA